VKVTIHINNASHQREHAAWARRGFERHGVQVAYSGWNVPADADLVVIWGWKQRRVIDAAQKRRKPILVMERGHLPPRMEFTSCGLNGLGNRAAYAKVEDGGARWRKHFGHLIQPWQNCQGYAVVCGQVRGDASLWNCDFHKWAQGAVDTLIARGLDVVYRPHPLSVRLQNDLWCPKGARFSRAQSPLVEELAGASLVVTYNSTSGVETVLAGVPTVTFDAGAMAWPVTTHSLEDAPIRPDRTAWAHDLAWSSWQSDEIADGTAWDHLKRALECDMAA
jgi:hypothetical protein